LDRGRPPRSELKGGRKAERRKRNRSFLTSPSLAVPLRPPGRPAGQVSVAQARCIPRAARGDRTSAPRRRRETPHVAQPFTPASFKDPSHDGAARGEQRAVRGRSWASLGGRAVVPEPSQARRTVWNVDLFAGDYAGGQDCSA
jgi:hypothetical protein